MRRDAKLSAKKLVEETDAKANKMVDDAFAAEKEQCDALLKDGREIAQKLYDDAMKEAENFCGRMAAQASEKQDAAVKFIAERIVESSVNS